MGNKSSGRNFNKKGSVTMEFVMIIPLLLIMILFIAQFFVAGMAVVETEVTLRDTVGNPDKVGFINRSG